MGTQLSVLVRCLEEARIHGCIIASVYSDVLGRGIASVCVVLSLGSALRFSSLGLDEAIIL